MRLVETKINMPTTLLAWFSTTYKPSFSGDPRLLIYNLPRPCTTVWRGHNRQIMPDDCSTELSSILSIAYFHGFRIPRWDAPTYHQQYPIPPDLASVRLYSFDISTSFTFYFGNELDISNGSGNHGEPGGHGVSVSISLVFHTGLFGFFFCFLEEYTSIVLPFRCTSLWNLLSSFETHPRLSDIFGHLTLLHYLISFWLV